MWIINTAIADSDVQSGDVWIRNRHTNQERVDFNPETGKCRQEVTDEIGEQLVDWDESFVPADQYEESDETTDTEDS